MIFRQSVLASAFAVFAASGCSLSRDHSAIDFAPPRADVSGFAPYMLHAPSVEVSLLASVATQSRSGVSGLSHDEGRGTSVVFADPFQSAEAWIGWATYSTQGQPSTDLFFIRGGMRLTEGYGPFYLYGSLGLGLEWMTVDGTTYSTVLLENFADDFSPVSVYYRVGAGLNAGIATLFVDFASTAALVADRDLIESGSLITWTTSAGIGARF